MVSNTICDYCPKTFFNSLNLLTHVRERHDLDPSVCIYCRKKFPPGRTRWFFENHLKYKCERDNDPPFENGTRNLSIPLSENNEKTNHWIYVDGDKFFLDLDRSNKVFAFNWPIFHYSDQSVLLSLCWSFIQDCWQMSAFPDDVNEEKDDDVDLLIEQLIKNIHL